MLARNVLRALLSTLILVFSSAASTVAAQVGSVVDDFRLDGSDPLLAGILTGQGRFGGSLASLGNLDGDGDPIHLAVGQPDAGGGSGGQVHLLELSASGVVVATQTFDVLSLGACAGAASMSEFGAAVANIGDLDGDGISELAVGGPEADDVDPDSGSVWILFLDASGSLRTCQRISEGAGNLGFDLLPAARFGSAIAGLGDVDGDGIPDMAVSNDPDGAAASDRVFVLALNSDGTVKTSLVLDATTPGIDALVDGGDEFGEALAGLGDLDGDQQVEFVIGAPEFSGSVSSVLLLEVDASLNLTSVVGLPDPPTVTGAEVGGALADLGDLDGDGNRELAVGSETFFGLYRYFVYSIDPSGVVVDSHLVDGQFASLLEPVEADDDFGRSIVALGDPDGDGLQEVAVGAPLADTALSDVGEIYLLTLSDGDPVAAFTSVQTVGCSPLTVAFTDQSSGSSVTDWLWDFGDGTTSTLASPTHVYASDGIYSVVLQVTGSDGVARVVRHQAAFVTDEFSLDFTASPVAGVPPLAVDFTNISSGLATSWFWDFGDGTTSSLRDPSHVYTVAGTYDVSLTAVCASGGTSETKVDFIVASTGPDASATQSNGLGVNPLVLSSTSDPVVGGTWQGEVDGGGIGATGLVFFVGYLSPLDIGLVTAFGELLVDTGTPFVALEIAVITGGVASFAIDIPNNGALLGVTFAGQGLLNFVAGSGVLTNRLDFVLGT